MKTLLTILTFALSTLSAHADEVTIEMVKATQSQSLWRFEITVSHPDEGSTHMMDSVAIFTPDEELLGLTKVPMPSIGAEHVTSLLDGVSIPEGVEYILIRGRCSNYGWSEESIIIPLM